MRSSAWPAPSRAFRTPPFDLPKLLEQIQELLTPFRTDAAREALLELLAAHPDLRGGLVPRGGEKQRVRSPVIHRGKPLYPSALFEPVEDFYHCCAFDAQAFSDLGLRSPRVGGDQHQHGKLTRAKIEWSEKADEVLEYLHLQPAHEIA